jgi:hypothetical protein
MLKAEGGMREPHRVGHRIELEFEGGPLRGIDSCPPEAAICCASTTVCGAQAFDDVRVPGI